MRKASGYLAMGLLLFIISGRTFSVNSGGSERYLLNNFWSGVLTGLLFALFVFNFYLGYIEKDLQKSSNESNS